MPKRGKDQKPSSRHSGGRFSPPPPPSQPPRQPRNDYQIAGPSRSTNDCVSGRRSPHTKDNIKTTNGNARPGNSSNRMHMSVVNSPIILTDDDDDEDVNVYMNLDTSVNNFQENGTKFKPDSGEGPSLVTHFVPSTDRYHMSQSASEKPVFRGPETDVLNELGKDKLKIIRVQMIRADIQHNDSFRKTYVVEDSVAGSRSNEKTNFDERQVHFNQNSPQIHYDNVDNSYGMAHPMSPTRLMSRDRSLSPRVNMVRPPSPPLPYSPERDHFNSENNMLRRDRPKRSPQRTGHDRSSRPEHFLEQMKMDNFSSGPPPEPRSPEMQRFRQGDHSRHRGTDTIHYEERPRHSRSPVYFENHYQYNRNISPNHNHRPFSPNHEQHLPISPPSLREVSPSMRDRPPHPNDRPRRRRTPPPRRDRSRERRRRISPRRRTTPPPLPPPARPPPVRSPPVRSSPVRSPIKRRENNGKKRGTNKNQEVLKREAKARKRRSQSKPKSAPQQDQQQQQQNSFQQPQAQPMYPPPPGVVRMPPRPFPPGPIMIPLRPPPFPPPMGAWRPPRPPMQAPPPAGWPYPRPRPFYFPY